jgi:hypothetical protein
MNRFVLAAALLFAACIAAPAEAQDASCPPAGYDRARLEALKAANWEISSRRERERFARAIAACVASPDPFLRDGVAFEALTHMLRNDRLATAVRVDLTRDMLARLRADEGEGFERPFAALVLSELARADRIAAYYDDAMRRETLDRAIAYFTTVRDYRGFDEREGWRHGVAHGADLLLQLALNPAFGADEIRRIRDALATQVAPQGHFYIYGESARLARPVIFMAQRGVLAEEDWTAWFAQFAPAEDEDLFSSQAGLARRHNMIAFASIVAAYARLTETAADDVLLPGAEALLRALP